MIREKSLLFEKLHGEVHRPLVRILSMLEETSYRIYDIRDFFEQCIALCERCEFQNEINPKLRTEKERKLSSTKQQKKEFI